MKNYQQTPRQRKAGKRKLELAKRAFAHSVPYYQPRESFTSKLKLGGVPVSTLANKEPSFMLDRNWRHNCWW